MTTDALRKLDTHAGARSDRNQADERDRSRSASSRRDRTGRDSSGRRSAGRGRVRGARTAIGIVVAIVALIAGGVVAYASPLMSVRSVSVTGTTTIEEQQIRSAANIRAGTPLLQVDTRPAAERIARIVRVKSVRVTRSYPSTIAISIVERIPVVFVMRSQTAHLIDLDGVDLGVPTAAELPVRPALGRGAGALPALPRLVEPDAGMDQQSRRSALEVAANLPESLRRMVIEVAADTPGDVRLTLRDKRVVVWGDAEQTDEKARTLRYLLTRPATEYNVTSPLFPTFR